MTQGWCEYAPSDGLIHYPTNLAGPFHCNVEIHCHYTIFLYKVEVFGCFQVKVAELPTPLMLLKPVDFFLCCHNSAFFFPVTRLSVSFQLLHLKHLSCPTAELQPWLRQGDPRGLLLVTLPTPFPPGKGFSVTLLMARRARMDEFPTWAAGFVCWGITMLSPRAAKGTCAFYKSTPER